MDSDELEEKSEEILDLIDDVATDDSIDHDDYRSFLLDLKSEIQSRLDGLKADEASRADEDSEDDDEEEDLEDPDED